MKKSTFKTMNKIIEGYQPTIIGQTAVIQNILSTQEESLFVLDYKSVLYQKTSGQKYEQGYDILLLPYAEIHSNTKQDLVQMLKNKTIVYFTYFESDQRYDDFVPHAGQQILSFMRHIFKCVQANPKARPVHFFLLDIESIGYIPKLARFMAGCRGFQVATCLFVEDADVLQYGYHPEEVQKIYKNSLIYRIQTNE